MIKAAVFDIDGTLLDSVDLHAEAWAEALAHFGHRIPVQEIRTQIGKGGDQLLPVFISQEELESRQKEIEEYRGSLFKEKYLSKVKPFPKVRELFVKLKDEGLKLALASSSKGDELQYYKRLAQVDDLLEAETSSEDAERSKPHPDIFQVALDRLGPDVQASEAIVVGDSPYDMEAAGKLNVKSVGVLCGGFPEKTLREAGAIAIFRDPADLLQRYDETPFASRSTAKAGVNLR